MPAPLTNYTVKVPLDLTSLPGTDKTVIWDNSAKNFDLGDSTGITINNYADNRITTATSDPSTLTAESYFRYVATGTGTTSGKVVLGDNSLDPYQILTISTAPVNPQLIIHTSNTDGTYIRLGLEDLDHTVIGFGAKTGANDKKFQIGTYNEETAGTFTPYFNMSHAGKIGIGVDASSVVLDDPNSLVEISGAFTAPDNEDTAPLEVTNLSTNGYQFNKGIIVRLNVQSGNNGGSLNNPQFIQFKRKASFGTGVFLTAGAIILDPSGQADLIGTSDLRLKTDIKPLSVGLKELLKIKPREYLWKDNLMPSRGFIAQELYEIYPEAANKPQIEDDPINNPWTVSQIKLIPLLVKSIQDQQKIIDKLEEKINKLENKNK